MATEKSLLRISDTPLIDKIVDLLEELFSEIVIITGKESVKNRFPGYPVEKDFFKEAGPLAGIHAALKTAVNPAVFVFACDMPCLEKSLISDMLEHYQTLQQSPGVYVPEHKSGFEPLHAIYHKSILPLIENQLEINRYKISELYTKTEVVYYQIPRESVSTFYNINTKEDIERLKYSSC